jgi:hypothetical protein
LIIPSANSSLVRRFVASDDPIAAALARAKAPPTDPPRKRPLASDCPGVREGGVVTQAYARQGAFHSMHVVCL